MVVAMAKAKAIDMAMAMANIMEENQESTLNQDHSNMVVDTTKLEGEHTLWGSKSNTSADNILVLEDVV